MTYKTVLFDLDGGDGDENLGYITGIHDGISAGFRYFDCKGVKKIGVTVRGYCGGEFRVKTAWDGETLATVKVISANIWQEFQSDIAIPDGVHAIYLEYKGGGDPQLKSFTLYC